jgi:hypothetical protein
MSNTWGLFAINPYTFNSGKITFWSFGYRQETITSTWPKEQRDPNITLLRVVQLSLNILGYTTLHPSIPTVAGGCRCLGGLITLYIALAYGGNANGIMAGHFCEEAQTTAIAQIGRGILEINQLQKVNQVLDFCMTFYNLINVGVYCIDYYNKSKTICFNPEKKQPATEELIPGPDYPWYHSFLYLA